MLNKLSIYVGDPSIPASPLRPPTKEDFDALAAEETQLQGMVQLEIYADKPGEMTGSIHSYPLFRTWDSYQEWSRREPAAHEAMGCYHHVHARGASAFLALEFRFLLLPCVIANDRNAVHSAQTSLGFRSSP